VETRARKCDQSHISSLHCSIHGASAHLLEVPRENAMARIRTAARALLVAWKVSEEEGGLDHSEGTWGFAYQSVSELRGKRFHLRPERVPTS
jgi:hypothetical protein